VLAFLGNSNIALLTGIILSLFSGRKLGSFVLREMFGKTVRRSGVVLHDICAGEVELFFSISAEEKLLSAVLAMKEQENF
jgi:H+/gluconate symporter-like permease